MRYEPDEADLVERPSAQGSRSNKNAQSKTRKELSQAYDDEETNRDTISRHQVRFSFMNESGIMINGNIGNTYNLSTSERG